MERILELDVPKIKRILKELGRTQGWLGLQSGVGRQWLHYDFKSGCTNRIHKYAKVFGMDIKGLIK